MESTGGLMEVSWSNGGLIGLMEVSWECNGGLMEV